MSHYILYIPVDASDVKVIREHLQEYLDNCGELKIMVGSDSAKPNDELTDTICKLFVKFLIELDNGNFEGLH